MLTEVHRKNRLKWTQDNKATNREQVIFLAEAIIHLNTVKELVWKLPGEKKVVRIAKHSTKVNVWGCLSSQDFGRIVHFKRNFNAELMCAIYKPGTAQKQVTLDSTI